MSANLLGQLIMCTTCSEVFLRSPFDAWPEYVDGVAYKKDDFVESMLKHEGHSLEELRVVGGFLSDKCFIEPVKTQFFQATNGKEIFIIKRARKKIDDPMRYKIVKGPLRDWIQKVEVDEVAVKKQLMRERPGLPIEQVDSFVKIAQQIVSGGHYYFYSLDSEDGLASDHPLTNLFAMSDVDAMYLKRNARNIFVADELSFIYGFIDRETKPDGVLAAKVTFGFKITKPRAKSVKHTLHS